MRNKDRDKRIRFVQLAITDKKKAADELRAIADGLENTKKTVDTIYALSQLFSISDRTIWRDIKTDLDL